MCYDATKKESWISVIIISIIDTPFTAPSQNMLYLLSWWCWNARFGTCFFLELSEAIPQL
jgi:hypothetical protein